jgi:hypothetical protein
MECFRRRNTFKFVEIETTLASSTNKFVELIRVNRTCFRVQRYSTILLKESLIFDIVPVVFEDLLEFNEFKIDLEYH